MPDPYPTQIDGARWLSSRRRALLADQPRVGKTGTAILAADDRFHDSILVVTTASGRAVWRRAFGQWSVFRRDNLRIIGWAELNNLKTRAELLSRHWDLLILDESHYGASFGAKRTQAVYGIPDGDGEHLLNAKALYAHASNVWCLSGTPIPHDPSNLYPMMRALCPERLRANPSKDWPDVTKFEDFRDRYCRWRPKKLNNWRTIIVIMGGKNEAELAERLDGFVLRRTQQDVGIRPPVYETLPLAVTPAMLRQVEGNIDRVAVLEAAREGNTKSLDMHLGPLRRLTGEAKARAVIEAVVDEFENGLDKIVLAYWHKDVGKILLDGLVKYGVTGIDGSSSPAARDGAEQRFLNDPECRVFLAQIEAAGEAIDLSSAAMLWFVESVFSPRSMSQMSLRITNHSQARQCFVRVCVLENSIDEAVNESLMRLWASIREVLK